MILPTNVRLLSKERMAAVLPPDVFGMLRVTVHVKLVASTENSCEHEWSTRTIYYENAIGEQVECSKCTAVKSYTERPYTCEHEWELVDEQIGSQYITKDYVCEKCGETRMDHYENTCVHEYQYRETIPNGENFDEVWECIHCGLEFWNPPDDWKNG